MQNQQVHPRSLSRNSLGCPVELQEQTQKVVYAPSPSTLSYWALICFTAEYLWAGLSISHRASVLQRMWKKTKLKPRTKEKILLIGEIWRQKALSFHSKLWGSFCHYNAGDDTWGWPEGRRGVRATVDLAFNIVRSVRVKTPVRTSMISSAHLLSERCSSGKAFFSFGSKIHFFLDCIICNFSLSTFAPQMPKQPSWHVLPSFFCRKPYGSVQFHLSWLFVFTVVGFSVLGVLGFFFLSDCNWSLCYGCHNSPHFHPGNLTWNSFCGSLLICGRVQGSELFCPEAYLEVGNQLKIISQLFQ